uniref:Uncharacterized protein n=1 Tax=Rhizophora mucronata TaxID=61149 RepID=A0A2P2NCE1_RHIMU
MYNWEGITFGPVGPPWTLFSSLVRSFGSPFFLSA